MPSTNITNTNAESSTGNASANATVKFTDVTQEAGLNFIQSDGGCGNRYFVEQVAAGAAVFDANGDGNLDIYFPQPVPLGDCVGKTPVSSHKLYLGDGKGNFKLSPNAFKGAKTEYGIAAAVGDFDNDGHPDLYVCCFGKNTLFRNNGDGTFTDVTKRAGVAVGGFSTGAVWFDYDGDGRLDLYVLRYCDWTIKTDIPCPSPDGGRDVCNPQTYSPSSNKLFHNNGNGTFTDVTEKSGAAPEKRRSLGVAAFDFDGDNHIDLFVANDIGPNYLLHNNGDGTFSEEAMQQGVAFGPNGRQQANMGVAVGDYNDSGHCSVLVTTFSNEPYTLYRNEGAGFTDVSEETGIAAATRPNLAFGTGFFDTRNCGRLDLFFASGHVSPFAHLTDPTHTYKQPNQLLLYDGKGRFANTPDALPANDVKVHRGANFGDFNNDGKMDILVTAENDRPTLLRNDTAGGNWLLVKLTAANGCCTPVGARCVATVGARKLTRLLLGGGSYGGESDQRVHFGLADSKAIDKLEIYWPSGKVQSFTNVKVNQILSVKEQ